MKSYMIFECPRDPEHTTGGFVGEEAPTCSLCKPADGTDMRAIEVIAKEDHLSLSGRIDRLEEQLASVPDALDARDRYDDLVAGLLVWARAKEGDWGATDEALARWSIAGGHGKL